LTDFTQRLARLAQNPEALKGIGRGLEREALRITPTGHLAQTPHPDALGSALTHRWITTDFAESLLEFITPVNTSVNGMLDELQDIHRFTYKQMGDEQLWPMSMPCVVASEDDITLAQYGSSNIGRMKTLYRQGLKHRYGSVMQVISGVHFNISLPETFWQHLYHTESVTQAQVTQGYFDLIRNYYRHGWMIPYLFGASPALCGTFIKHAKTRLPFEHLPSGTCYLPYATSLRLSDLGYTNNAQAELRIGFNTLEQYLEGLRSAIRTPSHEFAKLGIRDGDSYRQLNTNVLQIENELYAPIRPKRNAQSGEKPTEALDRAGVEYIEVRSLDVNPYSPVGIEQDQIHFLDLFVSWCALSPSDPMTDAELNCWRENWNKIVIEGRKPGLLLTTGCDGHQRTQAEWGLHVMAELKQLAVVMDRAVGDNRYEAVCDKMMACFDNPDLTLSGRLLADIIAQGGIGNVGLGLASAHKTALSGDDYRVHSDVEFLQEAAASLARQKDVEASDTLSFEAFLKDYFKDVPMAESW